MSRVQWVGEMCWSPFTETVRDLWRVWLSQWPTLPDGVNADPVWLPVGPGGQRMFCITYTCNADEPVCTESLATWRSYSPEIDTVANQPFLRWQARNVNVTDAQHGRLYLTSGVYGRHRVFRLLLAPC